MRGGETRGGQAPGRHQKVISGGTKKKEVEIIENPEKDL